ncbi:MAG: hypothetical protein DRG78_16090 [Epsilonproteobacteria bacterium]|nr:MAG: hypothetical protein DRG78_16090 [Campylobacterota bacterium]
MNKLYTITFATAIALMTSGCVGGSGSTPDVASLDVQNECNVKTHGVEGVLATAKKYNAIAQSKGLEFRRLGVNNSAYISAVEKALKDGSKTVQLIDVKKKKTKDKFTPEYAVQRSCKFAISALIQGNEAVNTWRLAVPGDGFKY